MLCAWAKINITAAGAVDRESIFSLFCRFLKKTMFCPYNNSLMGLSMCAPPVASNENDIRKVSKNNKNLFNRTVPGTTGWCQVPQGGARYHRTVPGATGRCQVPQDVARYLPQAPSLLQCHRMLEKAAPSLLWSHWALEKSARARFKSTVRSQSLFKITV